MSFNVSDDNRSLCLNGGTCLQLSDTTHKSTCSCTYEWTGENCELRLIDLSLSSVHQFSLKRANLLAGLSAFSVLLLVSGFMIIVYVRYRRKHRLYEDHLLKATAEELYRRPFNGRSSVVESLSRISSLRRTAACENKDDQQEQQSSTDDLEISISSKCVQGVDDDRQNINIINADEDSHKASEITDSISTDFVY